MIHTPGRIEKAWPKSGKGLPRGSSWFDAWRGVSEFSCMRRATAPAICGAANDVPLHRENASAGDVSAWLVKSRDFVPSTEVGRVPPPTAEQSTHQPRLENELGRRSAVRAPTETTRRNAAGQVGAVF